MTQQVSRHSLAFLFAVTLILVACERPLQHPLMPDVSPTEVMVEAPETVAEESATPVPELVTLPPETMEEAPEATAPSETAQPVATESESAGEAETELEADEIETEEATEVDEEAVGAETGEAEATEESDAAESAEAPAEGEQAAEGQEGAEEPAPEEAEAAPAEEAGPAEAGEDFQAEAEETGEESTAPLTHVVAAGENLFRIGQQYGISWVTLAQINHLTDPSYLGIGQVLIIATEAEPEQAPAQAIYVVQPGDTVFRISLRFGVDWQTLAGENGLEAPYVIYPGDELVIPGDP